MQKKILISLALTILLLIPVFLKTDFLSSDQYDGKENFDSSLLHLRTVSDLEHYSDSIANRSGIAFNTPQYGLLLEKIVSDRFFHGFSHLQNNENWIAVAAQKITGVGVACIVQPEEVMRYENAACSQQAIVMMEIFKRKKILYRDIGFPHHYALEGKFGDDWFYFDPDMEPRMNVTDRSHSSWCGNNDKLKAYYAHADAAYIDYQFGTGEHAQVGPTNEYVAPRLKLFQLITGIMSRYAWLIPLCYLVILLVRKRKTSAV